MPQSVPSTDLPFDNSPWILPLNKPAGMTSYDCIREVKNPLLDYLGRGKGRRKLKIGHFGTLDPFATGVLLVGTGKALKLMAYFQKLLSKTYLAKGTYLFSTDTGDIEGQKLKDSQFQERPTFSHLKTKAEGFVGPYFQKPPYFSAVKHEGRPLYEWAREGVFIDKDPVEREVYFLDLKKTNIEDEIEFKTEVSSGTYIRGLWVDLCQACGLEGHLTSLSREAWGSCLKGDCYTLEEAKEEIAKFLLRPDEIWKLPKVFLNSDAAHGFVQGQFLRPSSWDLSWEGKDAYQWVYGENKELLGLGIPHFVSGELRLKCEVLLCD